jgi:CBS domain-containing protein
MDLADTVRSVLKQKDQSIWSISPESSVYEAIQMMADRHVGALLVIAEDRLVGVISERDYARKVILQGRASKGTQVREIMTSPVMSAAPERTVEDCMRIMTPKRRLSRVCRTILPVAILVLNGPQSDLGVPVHRA